VVHCLQQSFHLMRVLVRKDQVGYFHGHQNKHNNQQGLNIFLYLGP
jgi:hypothetical protein